MGFSDGPCCWPLGRTNWAPVLGRCQGLGHFTGLTLSLGLASEPARLFFKPYHIYIYIGIRGKSKGLRDMPKMKYAVQHFQKRV